MAKLNLRNTMFALALLSLCAGVQATIAQAPSHAPLHVSMAADPTGGDPEPPPPGPDGHIQFR